MVRAQRDEPKSEHIADPAACASITFDASTAWNGSDVHPSLTDETEIQADLAALKTAIDANNAAIDAILIVLEARGLTLEA